MMTYEAVTPAQAIEAGLNAQMISDVVRHFYGLAREDALIGPIFRAHVPDERWQAHLTQIETFWCASLLRDRTYQGRPMGAHLRIAELDDRHFMRWLALFRHTVRTLCPPLVAGLFIARSERIAESFRMNLASHRGEDLVFRPPLKREAYP